MRPLDLQQIGEELVIKWEDGSEDYVPLERFRRGCPGAGCKGEVDVMGQLHQGPAQPLVLRFAWCTSPPWAGMPFNRIGETGTRAAFILSKT